jgi:hypothetical protein
MTTLREAAQQALEALEGVFEGDEKGAQYWTVTGGTYEAVYCKHAITALKAALEQPEQEPVAVPPPPKLTYTGGWWAITGARLIVETRHPVGYTTHRELGNDERQKWADWFKAMKEAQ